MSGDLSHLIILLHFLVSFLGCSELHFLNETFESGIHNESKSISPGVYRNGTFIIGGLFAVHFAAPNSSHNFDCVGRWNDRGFEEVKAMLYAIEKINNDERLLPGVKLGVDIKDTCNSIDFAIRSSLTFSFIHKSIQAINCPLMKSKVSSDTIAILGPGTSDVAMAVTNLAGLFHTPVVDYSSSSRLLNNRIRFKYFLRTVSSDILLSKAIVDLLIRLGWNFIHILYSDTDYGRSAIETFEYVLKTSIDIGAEICKATKTIIDIHSSKIYLDQIVKEIKSNNRAKGIVLLTTIQDAEMILNKFDEENMDDYVFIAPDYFSGSIGQFRCSPEMLRRVIGIVPHTNDGVSIHNISKKFSTKYIKDSLQHSSWERESKRERGFCHSLFVPYVIDAVYAIAHGLHNMLNCSKEVGCRTDAVQRFRDLNRNGDALLKSIQSVKFKGLTRDPVTFNQYGDGDGTYDINIVNPHTDQWMKFGSWASNGSDVDDTVAGNVSVLTIDEEMLREIWKITYNKTGIPSSVCGIKCPPGHLMRREERHQSCCWKCESCTKNYISNNPINTSCTKCSRRFWPNNNHSSCIPIIPTSVTIYDTPGIAVSIATTLGSLTVIVVAVVFFWYRDTHIVRSSSKRLSYVLLLGILLGYATSFSLLFEKSEVLCRITLFSFSISFCVIVGTLLTKTNRIHRIFSKKAMRNGTPPCLSDNWMLLFIAGFVIIEVIICIIIVLTSSNLKETIYSDESNEAFVQCKFTATYVNYNVALWWTYNTGIVLVCTYQAYLTRNVPGSHNEARFIAFTMITISTDVLVFFLSFYGTQGYYKDVLLSTFLIIAVTVTLCCVFLPKVYVILLEPEKNVDLNPVRSMGTIDNSEIEMRKISHMSQRSCFSYLSSSSTASAPENSKFISEHNAQEDGLAQRKERKMSVFVRNGIHLNSSSNTLDVSESGATSLEAMLDDNNHAMNAVSSTRKTKVTRMLSDMSVKSVHFEDEPSVIIEEFDPSYLDNYEYRRRKSTI